MQLESVIYNHGNETVDGIHPSMAFGTTGGKILIHSPHMKDMDNPLKGKNKE